MADVTVPNAHLGDPDEGLAAERTGLAWSRSTLAVLACLAILARRLWPLERADHLVAIVLLSIAVITWATTLSRGRALRRGRAEVVALTPRTARLITTATLVLAAAGFVLSLFPSPT